jgi:uncharacterized phage protein (TIGR01671 family)
MREIKFRAWDTKTKKFMYPWPEGFYLFGETTCFDLIGQQFDKGEDRLLRYNDVEVMQYTGLKDKNGKDIYEGDIISNGHMTEPNRAIIKWWNGGFHAENTAQEDSSLFNLVMSGALSSGTCEIIGNIYENPELLK